MSTTYVSYWEKLKDPRWQRRRLEVMERDGFRCRDCSDAESPLHVHHCYYVKGVEPWDYPDDCCKTLCEKCHDHRHEMRAEMDRLLSLLGRESLEQMLGYVKGWVLKFRDRPFSVSGHFEAFGALDAIVSRPIAYVANMPAEYPMSSEALSEAMKEVDAVMMPFMAYLPTREDKDAANG